METKQNIMDEFILLRTQLRTLPFPIMDDFILERMQHRAPFPTMDEFVLMAMRSDVTVCNECYAHLEREGHSIQNLPVRGCCCVEIRDGSCSPVRCNRCSVPVGCPMAMRTLRITYPDDW